MLFVISLRLNIDFENWKSDDIGAKKVACVRNTCVEKYKIFVSNCD